MSLATLWTLLVVGWGAAGAAIYLRLIWRARRTLQRAPLALGVIIAVVCAYPAILWGGQELGWWTISPDWGRPALVLSLAANAWLGLLALRQPGGQGR